MISAAILQALFLFPPSMLLLPPQPGEWHIFPSFMFTQCFISADETSVLFFYYYLLGVQMLTAENVCCSVMSVCFFSRSAEMNTESTVSVLQLGM